MLSPREEKPGEVKPLALLAPRFSLTLETSKLIGDAILITQS